MINTKEEIEKIEKLIQKESQRRDKIENGNYILAMLLKDIREGKVTNIVEVAEWCFEKIKIGKEVDYVLKQMTTFVFDIFFFWIFNFE